MSDKDLYGKEDFLHKGTSHIMDSKSPGRVPKYYHGKRGGLDGGKYHEIKHQKNPEAGTSKGPSEFAVGWKGAKKLRKDMSGKTVRLEHEYWKGQSCSHTQQKSLGRKRGTLLTGRGGKGGWIRKLVNNITGNPLE